MVSWGFAFKKGFIIWLWSIIWSIVGIFALIVAITGLYVMQNETIVLLFEVAIVTGSLSIAAYERKKVGEILQKGAHMRSRENS